MITLSLDEFGTFEKVKGKKNEAVFIGGLLYDDRDDKDELTTERKRIDLYYENVVSEASELLSRPLRYPTSLHYSDSTDPETHAMETEAVKAIKTIVSATIGEFLTKGTYKGNLLAQSLLGTEIPLPERKGKYYIYLILKSNRGKEERIRKQCGEWLNDNYAANCYFHMASETINRTVFQNPNVKKGESFSLELATRSTGTLERGDTLASQYAKLNYTEKRNLEGVYELTNKDIYRTVVEMYLMGKNENNISINNLRVKSICYKGSAGTQQFLFMADSICSYFSYGLSKEKDANADIWLDEIVEKGKMIIPEEDFLLFGYDDVDEIYKEALGAYLNFDYYKSWKKIFSVRGKEDAFSLFYNKKWFGYIEKDIEENEDADAFRSAVMKFYDSQLSNKYDKEEGLYILEQLEKKAERMKNIITAAERQSVFYYLYIAAMISYCHVGNSAEAEAYYNKARKYAQSVSSEEFIRARNVLAVCYCDKLEWEKAQKLAEDNVSYAKVITSIKGHIDEQVFMSNSILEGKAYSQLGQVYAFMKDERAESCFLKALSKITEHSADYYITESYLLHYYIDGGNKKKYEDYSKEYFGDRTSLKEQFDYVIGIDDANPIISKRFAMYVYVRALVVFYANDITEDLWFALKKLPAFNEHPAELIYKYICKISISRNDSEYTEIAIKHLENCLETQGSILNVIQQLALNGIYSELGETRLAESHKNEAEVVLADSFESFSGYLEMDSKKREEMISGNMTYMYR